MRQAKEAVVHTAVTDIEKEKGGREMVYIRGVLWDTVVEGNVFVPKNGYIDDSVQKAAFQIFQAVWNMHTPSGMQI